MFWAHQLIEYLLGVIVISQAIAAHRPAIPLAAGGLVFLLAATADGPLAAAKMVSRPLHRWCDVAVAVALIGTAVGARRWIDSIGQGLMVVAGVVLMALVWRSDYQPKVKRTISERLGVSGDGGSDRSEQVGRVAGRLAARSVQGAKQLKATRQRTRR
jgi:hypothetical protein